MEAKGKSSVSHLLREFGGCWSSLRWIEASCLGAERSGGLLCNEGVLRVRSEAYVFEEQPMLSELELI